MQSIEIQAFCWQLSSPLKFLAGHEDRAATGFLIAGFTKEISRDLRLHWMLRQLQISCSCEKTQFAKVTATRTCAGSKAELIFSADVFTFYLKTLNIISHCTHVIKLHVQSVFGSVAQRKQRIRIVFGEAWLSRGCVDFWLCVRTLSRWQLSQPTERCPNVACFQLEFLFACRALGSLARHHVQMCKFQPY